jgi:hypothetical protein
VPPLTRVAEWFRSSDISSLEGRAHGRHRPVARSWAFRHRPVAEIVSLGWNYLEHEAGG